MAEQAEVTVKMIAETPLAYLVSDDDGESAVWLPKSQTGLEYQADIGETVNVTIPEWLAIEKELV